MKFRIAINGFGRIGRQVAKIILANRDDSLELVAINSVEDIETCAFLLRHDSTQRVPTCNIDIRDSTLVFDDSPPISFFHFQTAQDLPWKDLGINLVVECSGTCTGTRRGKKSASEHLRAGAQKVLITAAATDSDITLCHGVNNALYDPLRHHLISASSCTTNCIAPVAKVIHDAFGIERGMATFLHSYTSNQPVLDSFGSDLRRSRSAALNIIPTTTSAENQLPIILPFLRDKFKAIAIRIPSPVVHLADFTIKIQRDISHEELFGVLDSAALKEMKDILSVSRQPLVSIDHRQSRFSSVVDFHGTKSYNDLVKILIWHDNEFSYSNRVVDLISFISNRI